jgi:ABC-type amino acid transport substrate-binding protein
MVRCRRYSSFLFTLTLIVPGHTGNDPPVSRDGRAKNYISIPLSEGDKEWRDFVDIQLLEMMTTGEYRKLLDKWFERIRGEFLEGFPKKEIKMKS